MASAVWPLGASRQWRASSVTPARRPGFPSAPRFALGTGTVLMGTTPLSRPKQGLSLQRFKANGVGLLKRREEHHQLPNFSTQERGTVEVPPIQNRGREQWRKAPRIPHSCLQDTVHTRPTVLRSPLPESTEHDSGPSPRPLPTGREPPVHPPRQEGLRRRRRHSSAGLPGLAAG